MSEESSKPFGKLFSDKAVEHMSIGRVAKWFESKEPGQLRLPPIQRSFVWRNEQVVNYWDSLLRGYPAGMMMVTRVDSEHSGGRNVDNQTETLAGSAFHLFDGQQRLLSLLLGLDKGALRNSLRLWIDIGGKPRSSEDRLFVLRVNSTGQPFGYRPDAPNQKPQVKDHHDAHRSWPMEDGRLKSPQKIFQEMASERTGTLSSAICAVRLDLIMSELMTAGVRIKLGLCSDLSRKPRRKLSTLMIC